MIYLVVELTVHQVFFLTVALNLVLLIVTAVMLVVMVPMNLMLHKNDLSMIYPISHAAESI